MTAPSSRRPSKPRKAPPLPRAPMPVIAPHDQGDDQSDDQSDEPAQPLRMIFKPEVIQRVGHSFPTIWKWMRAGKFPLSFQIGSKTAWREDEVDQWLASRPRSSFKQA